MSDVIRLLPDSVANQIAAGEVIQRPASVVKELVENAVDAGARSISVILKDAGRTLIQVVDDGCGMSDTDARMAFERHATSKITQADDLYTLHTMGFRGEALPSVAAVAQIDLRTMPRGAEIGTRIVISGSKVESQEPEACAPGTNLMVKNLFFNIPVRRKFLKKDAVEMSNTLREFERLALVNPSLELSIVHNDVTLHHLLPATFKQRVMDLFGKSLERQIIPIAADTSIVKIEGYISLPEHARKRGNLQYFMVNGRNMRHPYFHKALLQCYADLISAESQPMYFINLEVDPSTIDVNIHPTKNEIKFENEQPIWQILTAAVKESLSRYNAFPSIDFNREDAPEIPAFNPDLNAPHTLKVDHDYNPFKAAGGSIGTTRTTAFSRPATPRSIDTTDWAALYDSFSGAASTDASSSALPSSGQSTQASLLDDEDITPSSAENGALLFKHKYIVTASRGGLMLIDVHRAHVAVLFRQYMSRARSVDIDSQKVMFPEVITLSASQASVMSLIQPEVKKLGFEVEHVDDSQWEIKSIPGLLNGGNPADTLLRMLDTVVATGEDPTDDMLSRVAMSMAESAARRGDNPLSIAEREQLLASLFSLPDPSYTPDGRRIIVTLTLDDIGRMF